MPTIKPTKTPIVTQKPIYIPSASTMPPSDEVVTSPPVITPNPTAPSYIPDDPYDQIENNYSRLSECLIKNGIKHNAYGGGYYYKYNCKTLLSNSTLNYSINYFPDNSAFVFDFIGVTKSDTSIISMKIFPGKINCVSIQFTDIENNSENINCNGMTYIDISKYQRKQELLFMYDKEYVDKLKKSYDALGSTVYELSTMCWESCIRQFNIGLTIQDLGFTSY